MEGLELRIPIAGVIEEAAYVSTTCSLLEYYPQGEGMYLVKNPDGGRKLRKVSGSYMGGDGRKRCVIGNLSIPSGIDAEDIKREHEDTLKEYIKEVYQDLLSGIIDVRGDIKMVYDHISKFYPTTVEDAANSGKKAFYVEEGVTLCSGAKLNDGTAPNDDRKPGFVPLQGSGVSEATLLKALEIVMGAKVQQQKDL